MSWELIYTSAFRGLKPGSRGFCTVARTAGMSPGLEQALEGISGYRWLDAHAGQALQQPVNILFSRAQSAGRAFPVLSRIGDAGADYTGRTNKLAHHIVFNDAHEMTACPRGPAWAALQPGLFETRWTAEPAELPPNRKPCRADTHSGPATAWAALGDSGWAGILAQRLASNPASQNALIFRPGQDLLHAVDEVLALLPLAQRWQTTFSTYLTDRPTSICNIQCVLPDSPLLTDLRRNPQAWLWDLSSGNVKVVQGGASLDWREAQERVAWSRTAAPADARTSNATAAAVVAAPASGGKRVVIGAPQPIAEKPQATAALTLATATTAPRPSAAADSDLSLEGQRESGRTHELDGEPSGRGNGWLITIIVAVAAVVFGVILRSVMSDPAGKIKTSDGAPPTTVPEADSASSEPPEFKKTLTEPASGRVGEPYIHHFTIEHGDEIEFEKSSKRPEGLKIDGLTLKGIPTTRFDDSIVLVAKRQNQKSPARTFKLKIMSKKPELMEFKETATVDAAFDTQLGKDVDASFHFVLENPKTEVRDALPVYDLGSTGKLHVVFSKSGKYHLDFKIINPENEEADGTVFFEVVSRPSVTKPPLTKAELPPEKRKTETPKSEPIWLDLGASILGVDSPSTSLIKEKIEIALVTNPDGSKDYEFRVGSKNVITISQKERSVRVKSTDESIAIALNADFKFVVHTGALPADDKHISKRISNDRQLRTLLLKDKECQLYELCNATVNDSKLIPLGGERLGLESKRFTVSPKSAGNECEISIEKAVPTAGLGKGPDSKVTVIASVLLENGEFLFKTKESKESDNDDVSLLLSLKFNVYNKADARIAEVTLISSADNANIQKEQRAAVNLATSQELDERVKKELDEPIKALGLSETELSQKMAEGKAAIQNWDVHQDRLENFISQAKGKWQSSKTALLSAANQLLSVALPEEIDDLKMKIKKFCGQTYSDSVLGDFDRKNRRFLGVVR